MQPEREESMEQMPNNPNCKLSGTRYCQLLNMGSCDHCTIRGSDEMDRFMEDMDVYEGLLPEGGVARLFTDNKCQFCKTEEKGDRSGYAIIDMAHPLPKRVQKWLLGKRTLRIGTMIPVQMSICSKCRRRFMFIEYLPVAVPVLLGLIGLLLFSTQGIGGALANINSMLPFFIWVALIAAGILLGRALSNGLRRKYSTEMYTEALEHPVLAEMVEKGWTTLTKQTHTKLLFSKSRMARGLGTAVDVPPRETPAEESAQPTEESR